MLISTTLLSGPRRRNWGRISPIPTPGTERTAMSIKRHGVGPRLSQAAVHGDTVYLAGMVAGDPSADTKGQTELFVKKIDETLAADCRHKYTLISATVYIEHLAIYSSCNV